MITHTQSLQPSPTHSGRLFSDSGSRHPHPIEITALGSSRCSSTENLAAKHLAAAAAASAQTNSFYKSMSSASLHDSTDSFELRRTFSRRSLRGSSRRSTAATTDDEDPDVNGVNDLYDDLVQSSHVRMLEERHAELQKRLKEFESGPAIVLTPYEARSLVALLHTDDCDTLQRALVAVANSCAFSANQERIRDACGLHRLESLVIHPHASVKLAAMRAVANLALNLDNQREMSRTVSNLLTVLDEVSTTQLSTRLGVDGEGEEVGLVQSGNGGELTVQVLQTLTNVAALNDHHHLFANSIPRVWNLLVSSGHGPIRVQSLRLLTNLSTNDDMTEDILTPQVPFGFWGMIDIGTPEEVLLRAISLIANLIASDLKRSIIMSAHPPSSATNSHNPRQLQTAAASNGNAIHLDNGQQLDNLTRFGLLPEALSPVLTRLAKLMLSHPHEDVRTKARNVLNLIKGQ